MPLDKCNFDCTYCKTPCYKAKQTASIEKIRQKARLEQEQRKLLHK